ARDRRVARAGRELLLGIGIPKPGRVLGNGLGLGSVGQGFELGLFLLDDWVRLAVGLVQREILMRRHAAVLPARERCVRAALAARQDGGAAPGEVAFLAAVAAEGRLGLLLGELGVADDVDLPAGEPVRKASVHALLADRERKLIVGDDDRG